MDTSYFADQDFMFKIYEIIKCDGLLQITTLNNTKLHLDQLHEKMLLTPYCISSNNIKL